MIEDQYKPINKGNLFAATEKLKRVLHPTITREAWPSYEETPVIELITDIPETDELYPISFYIKCLNFIDSDTKVISSEGFITSNLNEYGVINTGSSKLLKIASKLDGVLKIALIPEDGVILKTEAEVFICDDNKNHLVAINYIEENDEYYDFQDITGDIDTNFHYLVNTGSEYIDIENGVNRTQPIDTIYHSVDAQELTHPINVKIKGVDSNDNSKLIFESPLTQVGTQSGDETTIIAQVSVEDIAESVKEEVLDEFPIADIDVVGGIALTTKSNLETNQFPIELTNNHLAYIDLSNYQPSMNADIHRFAVVPADAAAAGTNLILYIGATTADYVRGYYYLWAPTEFTVSSESDGWSEIREGGQGVAGNKIAAYNRERDFVLKVNTPIVITLSDTLTTGDLISNDTLFNISQGNTFTEDITYSDIKSKLGFELSSGFITYDSTKDYNLTLSLTTTASAWKQKNVLPMVKVGSPLFFKGTTTWEELQSYSPTAEIGDFYIVSDKANLEYYWTGTEWEFMGDIFDPYEGGDGINITSTHDISVKYDNVTIKKNNDGNLYVDGELTDTTYSAGTGLSLSGTTFNHSNSVTAGTAQGSATKTLTFGDTFDIPTVTYDALGHVTSKGTTTMTMPANPNTDTQANWNETNTSSAAYILNKPTIPTVNDATYSVKTDVAGTETTVSDFTANLSTADSVTFVQGNNITLTPDSTNKKITIAATDTTYNTATSSVAGLVKSQTTGTTIGRDYNVEVNSNGTMKVNVPWTDTNTTYQFEQVDNSLKMGTDGGTKSVIYTPTLTQGPRGYDFQYVWDGTRLGVKSSDQSSYTYVDLKGDPGTNGTNGSNGKNLEFNWNGTQLGVRQEGQSSYTYVDLKGDPGTNGTNGTNGQDGVSIVSVTKTDTSGLVDTYTITYSNNNTSTFTVTNGSNGTNGTDGVSITSVTKTGTSGLVDTYTITYSNSNTSTFNVTNGSNGTNGTDGKSLEFNWSGTQLGIRQEGQSSYTYVDLKGANGSNGTNGTSSYLFIRYYSSSLKQDSSTTAHTTPQTGDKWIGIGINSVNSYPGNTALDWSKFVGEDGSAGSVDWNDITNKPNLVTVDGSGGATGIGTYVPVGAIQMYAGSTAPTGWLLCNGNIILIDSNSKSIAQEIQSKSFAAEALDDLLDVIGTSFGSFIIRQSPANGNKYIKKGTLSGTTFTVLSWTANVQQAYLFTTNLLIEQYLYIGGTITDLVALNVISIPDLRKTFPVGASTTSAYNLGKTGGEATHELTEAELPSHTHYVSEFISAQDKADKPDSTNPGKFNVITTSGGTKRRTIQSPDSDEENYSVITPIQGGVLGGYTPKQSAEHNFMTLSSTGSGTAHNNIPPYLALNFIIKY